MLMGCVDVQRMGMSMALPAPSLAPAGASVGMERGRVEHGLGDDAHRSPPRALVILYRARGVVSVHHHPPNRRQWATSLGRAFASWTQRSTSFRVGRRRTSLFSAFSRSRVPWRVVGTR